MDEVHLLQNELFCLLDDHFYLGSDDLHKFKLRARSYLTCNPDERKRCSEICDALIEREVIKLGNYEKLTGMVKKISIPLAEKIEDYQQSIKEAMEASHAIASNGSVTHSMRRENQACPDERTVELIFDYIASKLGQEILLLATEIGIESETLARLEYEYPRNPQEKNFHVLYRWKIKDHKADHLTGLKNALENLDRRDLVDEISAFYRENFKCCEQIHGGTKLVSDKDLLLISQELNTNSFRLGRFLRVTQNKISQIKEDNVSSISEQAFQILKCWKQAQATDASRQALCDGLTYIQHQSLIDKLNQKWLREEQ